MRLTVVTDWQQPTFCQQLHKDIGTDGSQVVTAVTDRETRKGPKTGGKLPPNISAHHMLQATGTSRPPSCFA